MAGIYIPGMELPKGCFVCLFNTHYDPYTDECLLTTHYHDPDDFIERRAARCPLVPVPDHGDLIDRDALVELQEITYEHSNGYVKDRSAQMIVILQAAPTVIPSDKEDT